MSVTNAKLKTLAAAGKRWRGRLLAVGALSLALVAAVIIFNVHVAVTGTSNSPSLFPSPGGLPLEYIYLDSARVDNYLGEIEDGLAGSQQRTEQLTNNISAGLTAGTAAQVSASQALEEGTQEIVTPNAEDRFYQLLSVLRQSDVRACLNSAASALDGCDARYCRRASAGAWLGDLQDQPQAQDLLAKLLSCMTVGTFVRLSDVQLFLPPFAQVLPNTQGATAYYGREPWVRRAFTSPARSTRPALINAYVRALGPDPRLPFVAAPYGGIDRIGPGRGAKGSLAILLPLDYKGLTSEPSLLSGSVTVVGKIVYAALNGGPAYVDYPSITEFASALLREGPAFSNDLGVCASKPPDESPSHSSAAGAKRHSGCYSYAALLQAVKGSVTFKPPFVVILPVAIYQ